MASDSLGLPHIETSQDGINGIGVNKLIERLMWLWRSRIVRGIITEEFGEVVQLSASVLVLLSTLHQPGQQQQRMILERDMLWRSIRRDAGCDIRFLGCHFDGDGELSLGITGRRVSLQLDEAQMKLTRKQACEVMKIGLFT